SSSVLHSRLPRLWFLRTVTPCTATYTQSLHDALPICVAVGIKYPKNFRTEGYVSSPSRSCGCPALKVRRVSLEFPARMGSQVKTVSPALRVKQASPDLPVLPVLQDRLVSLAKTARMEKTENAARKGIGDPRANKVRQAKTHHPPSTSMTWVR